MAIIRASNRDAEILVDDEDYEALSKWKWSVHTDGSAVRRRSLQDGTRTNWLERMHRELMGIPPGDKRVVDHINGNRLDNRRDNLRICTQKQNLLNSRVRSTSKSGLKGVTSISKSTWAAYINLNGKRYSVNGFTSPEDAFEFACLMREEMHGEFANHG